MTNEKAAATRRACRSDFAIFKQWCEKRDLEHLPASPKTVATFLSSQAADGAKAATLSRRVASIRYAHKLKNTAPTTNDEHVKATMRGIRRSIATAQDKKASLTAERLLQALEHVPDSLICRRDQRHLVARLRRRIQALGVSGSHYRRSSSRDFPDDLCPSTSASFLIFMRMQSLAKCTCVTIIVVHSCVLPDFSEVTPSVAPFRSPMFLYDGPAIS